VQKNTFPFHLGSDGKSVRRCAVSLMRNLMFSVSQGLTLIHFSAQLEPCLIHKNTLHTPNTPLTRATQPLRAPPVPLKALKLS